jgi:protein associated with RNAse G/E
MTQITVCKLNHLGQETWRYPASILYQDDEKILLEAYFDRQNISFHGVTLNTGDRFMETYYTNRWYNIFEIRNWHDDSLKCWYCNVGKPVVIDGETLSYVDLALDLLVFPDGRQIVLDEEEFENLPLTEEVRLNAHKALIELQTRFQVGRL